VSALLVDIGNTRIKWVLRDRGETTATGVTDKANAARFNWPRSPERIVVSSVQDNRELHELFEGLFGERLRWLGTPVYDYQFFRHCYRDPARLGVDRWLAMIGARQHSDGDLLVVDAGTALTLDVFSAENQHQGGYIVPGLQMARQALFGGTDKVRQFGDEQDAATLTLGTNTVNCVAAGTLRQQLALVQHVVDEYPDHHIFITGGDGELIADNLNARYYPDLIFDGMDSLCAGLFTA
jgi:type III pantothenate kinase